MQTVRFVRASWTRNFPRFIQVAIDASLFLWGTFVPCKVDSTRHLTQILPWLKTNAELLCTNVDGDVKK